MFHRRHGFQLFSTGEATVDDIVAERMADHRVITAESCTGGLDPARLTNRPGSSGYVVGGVVACSVDVTRTLLRVPARVFSERGVVSPHTAEHMAKGALALSESLKLGADTAIAVTGVAGPGSGSDEIPVGTVCLCAMSRGGGMIVCRVKLPGDRGEVASASHGARDAHASRRPEAPSGSTSGTRSTPSGGSAASSTSPTRRSTYNTTGTTMVRRLAYERRRPTTRSAALPCGHPAVPKVAVINQ